MGSAARLALLLAAAGCGAGAGEDPVVAAVRAGVEAQLGVKPDRVACSRQRCEVDVGGVRVGVTVEGEREVTWEADEVVLAAPLVAHVTAELAGLGIVARVDCGAPVQALPADGRLACRIDDGGVAWVGLGEGGRIDVEVALTADQVAGRTAPSEDDALDRRSRALDSDEAEGEAEPGDDHDDDAGVDGVDAGVVTPAPRGAGG